MPRLVKIVLYLVIVVLVLLTVISRYLPAVGQPAEVSYSTFLDDVKANRVDSVILQDDMLFATLKDKQQFKSHRPQTDDSALMSKLEKAGVLTERRAPKHAYFFPRLLLLLAPLLLILVFVWKSYSRPARPV
jgi:ATP-dependent Zn protease